MRKNNGFVRGDCKGHDLKMIFKGALIRYPSALFRDFSNLLELLFMEI